MVAATGTVRGQLDVHLRAVLRLALSHEELSEIVLQVAVHAGARAVLNGLAAVRAATGKLVPVEQG